MILVCSRMCTGKSQDGRLIQLRPGDQLEVIKRVKQGWLMKKDDIKIIVDESVVRRAQLIK